MSLVPLCIIPADPDISGIGVRVAIYIQNLLSFVPVVWALWDGEVSEYELESVETQSTTILITAFAILISAMVQATRGLSSFHASIVLNLSWMNNTNTFIYFLLYVQHKTQAGPSHIKPNLSSWMAHLRRRLSGSLSFREECPDVRGAAGTAASPPLARIYPPPPVTIYPDSPAGPYSSLLPPPGTIHPPVALAPLSPPVGSPRPLPPPVGSYPPSLPPVKYYLTPSSIDNRHVSVAGTNSLQRRISVIFRRIVLVLGSLHLSLMAALGLWLWSNPRLFGSANSCIDRASIIILGKRISLASDALRTWSIAIYALFLVPGLNMILPTTLFLGMFLYYQKWDGQRRPQDGHSDPSPNSRHASSSGSPPLKIFIRLLRKWSNCPSSSPSIFPTLFGMTCLFAINIAFLVDIELTLQQNRRMQNTGESFWTFGQILAMILLVLPLRDIVETMVARQEKQRKDELARRETQRKAEHTASLAQAIWGNATKETLWELLRKGADVDVVAEGCPYPTVLLLAVFRGDTIFVNQLLLNYSADPNIKGGGYGTALQEAILRRNTEIIKLLLEYGADPNAQGGEYCTALQAAAHCDEVSYVKLLLDRGADPNIQGGWYGTALLAASVRMTFDVAKMLLESGANPNLCVEYGTALQEAISVNRLQTVELLLEYGAEINLRAGQYGTALQMASYFGYVDIVKLLLDRGADPNIAGGLYCTALQAASDQVKPEIVTMLLESGADTNIQGGMYGTALQAVSFRAYIPIAKMLLAAGADVNIPGGKYGTALRAACLAQMMDNNEMVRLLFDNGADPNIKAADGGTAIEAAVAAKSLWIIELFLGKWDFDIKDPDGQLLQTACWNEHLDIVPRILRTHPDAINIQGGDFGSALQAASCANYRGNLEIVKTLLKSGADPNVRGGQYDTALQAASCVGNLEMVKLILEHGADVNTQGGHFGTALQAASFANHEDGNLEIVSLLLKSGADPNIQGGQYGTALWEASRRGLTEIVALLHANGATGTEWIPTPPLSRTILSNLHRQSALRLPEASTVTQ